MNLTLSQWEETLKDLQKEVSFRWPWIKVSISSSGNGLWVQNETCSGNLSLEIDPKELRHLCAKPKIGSGRSLSGTLSEMENGIAEYRVVVDILHYLATRTSSLRIFPNAKE